MNKNRSHSKYPPALVRKAKDLRERGLTIRAVAREMRLPLGTVTTWLYEYTRSDVTLDSGWLSPIEPRPKK